MNNLRNELIRTGILVPAPYDKRPELAHYHAENPLPPRPPREDLPDIGHAYGYAAPRRRTRLRESR